jgi:hypothetical protein
MNILLILQVRSSLDIYWTEQHTVVILVQLYQIQVSHTDLVIKWLSLFATKLLTSGKNNITDCSWFYLPNHALVNFFLEDYYFPELAVHKYDSWNWENL